MPKRIHSLSARLALNSREGEEAPGAPPVERWVFPAVYTIACICYGCKREVG